jgi:peptide methionine sulfoxide reductase MsrA
VIANTPLKKIIPSISTNVGGHGQSLLRYREADTTKKTDILFLGSSHANKGFDTRIFHINNIAALNLGSGLQTPQNSFYLLKKYLPTIKTKLVIMELYWDVLEYKDGIEACIDITSNSTASINMIEMNLSTKNNLVINSMLASYFSSATKPLSSQNQKIIKGEQYIKGGYITGNYDRLFVKKSIKELKPRKLKLEQNQLNYLTKIIDYCKQHHTQLLFVTAPIPVEHLNYLTNYNNAISEIKNSISFSNILWLNFNDETYRTQLKLNTIEDFSDANHLNQNGVNKFNWVLIKEIKKIAEDFKH